MPETKNVAVIAAVLLFAVGLFAQQPTTTAAPPVPSIMRVPDANRAPMISLAPAIVTLRATFGQTVTETLTISNDTAADYSFEMVAQDVVVRDGKRVFLPAGQLPNSIAQSAVFSQNEGTAATHTSQNVTVRFTVPAQTDLRAVVALFRGKPGKPAGQNAIAMTASLGALITFNITDAVAVVTEPVKVTVDPSTSTVAISDVLRNAGKEPVVPTGIAAILDAHGKLVGKVTFTGQRLLPGEQLPFRAEYAGGLPPASYKVLCSFDLGGKQVTSSGAFKIE